MAPSFSDHKVGEAVAHGAVVFAHETQYRGNAFGLPSEQRAERLHIDPVPSEYSVGPSPSRGNGAKDQGQSGLCSDGERAFR